MDTTGRILASVLPTLKGRTIADAVFGLSLIVLQLDDGMLGSALLLMEELHTCQDIYPVTKEIIGASAEKIALWSVEGSDALQRAIGFAVINAAAHYQIPSDKEAVEARDAVEVRRGETVGMVGNIHALNDYVRSMTDKLYIFDRGAPGPGIEPEERQAELLPLCDVVLITGSSFLNESFPHVAGLCSRAREVWVIGPSTPMYPLAYADLPVTHIAGMLWQAQYKDEIFKAVSLGAVTKDISQFAKKITISL